MRKIMPVTLALSGLIASLVMGQFVLAAGPAPAYGQPALGQQTLGSGTIDIVNLGQGFIVVNDGKYLLSDKVTVHGRNSGTKLSLAKGMHIQFAAEPGLNQGRSVITEIWIVQ